MNTEGGKARFIAAYRNENVDYILSNADDMVKYIQLPISLARLFVHP